MLIFEPVILELFYVVVQLRNIMKTGFLRKKFKTREKVKHQRLHAVNYIFEKDCKTKEKHFQ